MTSPASPPPSTTIPPAEVARAAEAAKAAKRLQDAADTLRAQAAAVKDPAERERLFHTAYDNEVEACGQSKKARLMASGWGQGAAAGVGASGALGMALGNLVGVLLGGVVAIPGVLVGAGVGALHGPWYKIPGGFGAGGEGAKGKAVEGLEGDEKVHRAVVEAARRIEEEEGKGEGRKRGGELEGKEEEKTEMEQTDSSRDGEETRGQ